MFDSKKKSLFENEEKASAPSDSIRRVETVDNPFIRADLRESAVTTSLGNGARKLTTTGSDFVDQFAKATNYREPRLYESISQDMETLWSISPIKALKLTFYLRTISRVTCLPNGSKTLTTQRGQGLKHEGIFRMMWIAINHPEVFWMNLPLFISVGSWKDIIVMLSYDLQYHGWEGRVLDWDNFGNIIFAGLENPNTSNLVKKYLPQIKSKSKCRTVEAQADTMIAKWICSVIYGNKQSSLTYYQYRKLKTSGTAHTWQQLISQKKFLEINFDTVAGRALSQLVSSKFLVNNQLEDKYEKWISSKPIAKFTGYVYELLSPVKDGFENKYLKNYQKDTINKQFYGLIETATNGMKTDSSLIVVVDTSSSMTGTVPGTNVSAYDVAKSMALYFSYLLKGVFNKSWMEFATTCKLKYWVGATPVDQLQNDRSEAYGSTNFQSVGDRFGQILKSGVPESDFPTGILCVSDGCFNCSYNNPNQSNFKGLLGTLRHYGFSEEFIKNFKVILWDIPNNYYSGKSQTAFEEFADCPNLYHMSGLDGSAVAFIMGTDYNPTIPKNSAELFEAAMSQEILDMLEI